MRGHTAGLDEAGRGPLAGPVVAAAVVLDPNKPIVGVTDSKQLTPARRNELYAHIVDVAVSFGIGSVDAQAIDELNVLQASLQAMREAFAALTVDVSDAWVDGNQDPDLPVQTTMLVGGDGIRKDIGAASIVAKVTRDRLMQVFATQFPGYGFEHNMGYATPDHLASLRRLGPCPIHRRSFAPVREAPLQGFTFS